MERKGMLWAIIVGAAAAELLVGWLAPKYLLWYFDPPVHTGCTCTEAVGWAVGHLQRAQLIALAIGGILGALILWIMRRRGGRTRPVNPY